MLTFETLFEILRKEKFNQELQKLDEDFFEDIIQYIEEKTAVLNTEQKSDSIFSTDARKTQLQLENAKRIIKELYEKRESKIINLAIMSSRAEIKESGANMLREERKIFRESTELLNNYRADILYNLLKGEKVSLKKKKITPKDIKTKLNQKSEGKLIRFLHSVPKFVADDLNIYGPFENEDMGNIPKKTADLLIKRNRAEEIKIENSKE
jgi:DNA replication initiation complex subunit (GINS family)